MDENFETILKMIFGDECRIVADSLAITDIDEQKDRYHVVVNNDNVSIDEWVYCIGVMINKSGEIGYAFRLQEFTVRDCVDEFFNLDFENKAVIVYIDGKTYTNCDKLKDKYIFDISLSWENKLKCRGKEYRIYTSNSKYRVYKMVAIERKEQ